MMIYYMILNIGTFIIYGIDKRKAVKRKWRISERTLLGAALFGGGLGALLGMYLFRHKTKHWKFQILVPCFMVLHLVLYVMAVRLL